MAISPSRASPSATPKSAARPSSRAWWCGRRRLPPNYDPDVFPDPTALRHSSQAEAHPLVRRRPASLRRQHPRPHHHHHRDPAAAGAFPEGASYRSELHSGLWRRGRRIAAAKPADADPLSAHVRLPAHMTPPACAQGAICPTLAAKEDQPVATPAIRRRSTGRLSHQGGEHVRFNFGPAWIACGRKLCVYGRGGIAARGPAGFQPVGQVEPGRQ